MFSCFKCFKDDFNGNNMLQWLWKGVQYQALRERCAREMSLAGYAVWECGTRVVYLRAGIWDYKKTKYPLFVSLDWNAHFSEIFQWTTSCDFVDEIDPLAAISRKLMWFFTYEPFCKNCDKNCKAKNEVFVNYISLSDLITQI